MFCAWGFDEKKITGRCNDDIDSTSCMLSQVHRFTHCQRQPPEGGWQGKDGLDSRIERREMGAGRVRPQATSLCLEPPGPFQASPTLALGRDTLGYLVPAVRGSPRVLLWR